MSDRIDPTGPEPLGGIAGQASQMASMAVLVGLQEAERLVTVRLARALRRAAPDLQVPEPPPIPAASADLLMVSDSMREFGVFTEEMGRVLDRLGGVKMGEHENGQVQGLLDALRTIMERRRAVSDLLGQGGAASSSE